MARVCYDAFEVNLMYFPLSILIVHELIHQNLSMTWNYVREEDVSVI